MKHFYAEDYSEDLAVAHIKRLLDIVACTTSFAGSSTKTTTGRTGSKEPGPIEIQPGPDNVGSEFAYKSEKTDKKLGSAAGGRALGGEDLPEKGDAAAALLYPPPRLGQFYDFLSFSHLTPPIQCEFLFSFFGTLCQCACHLLFGSRES